MGLLSEGTPLDWPSTQQYADLVRTHGIKQFIHIYEQFKERRNDTFKWGDELEFSLVKFDHANQRCYLLLKAEQSLAELSSNRQAKFQPEYASYMVESTPSLPFGNTLDAFKYLEQNMKLRRDLIQSKLDKDEHCMSLTNFPLLGCSNFTWPRHEPSPRDGITKSLFFPDQAIFGGHPRFKTLSRNVPMRRQAKPAIYVPIYADQNTPRPFREEILRDNTDDLREDMIYLDAVGFGMGCCCLQVTFQAESINEARRLYDQLAPITPIMLALTAASPVWRGYLSNVDCRWNIISGSVDDRTQEERDPSSEHSISKSRYDSIDSYLSVKDTSLNDINLKINQKAYDDLIESGIDDLLAKHIAHLFIRDPIVLFQEKINTDGEMRDADHFENIQSTNWQSMRFKPPPFDVTAAEQIGWRVEFRTPELQLTDFENSAFCAFIILLVRAIQTFELNFLMPISKIDVNMQRAQKINACQQEKFYFRNDNADVVEMSINEIINGSREKNFTGLLGFIENYLKQLKEECASDAFTQRKISQYLLLVKSRANGDLLTLAALIRKLVREHPDYKHDSVVSERINYDLIWRLHQISTGDMECSEFLFKSFKTSCI